MVPWHAVSLFVPESRGDFRTALLYHLSPMPLVRTRLDPEGYYARLGLEPTAAQAAITAAFRGKARVLHPDVPKTGDTDAFVAVRQAYDVLSNQQRRKEYDRAARAAALEQAEPEVLVTRPTPPPPVMPMRRPRFSDLPLAVWLGAGALLCVSVVEAVIHVQQPPKVLSAGIRPNAATIEPLSPAAHFAALYGPAPILLGGVPNFYVVPAGTPAVLWRVDQARKGLLPDRQLPPFSSVQAVRFLRQNGLLEVVVQDQPNGYIETAHLTPGNAAAARRAYCSYNAGPSPSDGEVFDRAGSGSGRLRLDNRAVQPAVVKLRTPSGAVAVSVFLAPGGHADLEALPDGTYTADFAIGELWSRACNSFAAGMRARRLDRAFNIPGDAELEIATDAASLPSTDIADQVFEQSGN